jgi:integrase
MDRPKVQTAIVELKLLRRVMAEAVRRGFVDKNPLADLHLKKPKHKEKPEISTEEEAAIRAALATMEGHLPVTQRWMTVSFLFGIRHGWRIAETSFPLKRVDFTAWEVLVHSKGDKWRTVPVHPELRPILTALREAGAKLSCVFPDGGRPEDGSRHWSMMLRGCERDNIKGILPHLCHHCCRVSVISRLARAGVPERLVMEFVGHWSVTSHRIYSRVAHGDLARCIFPDGPASVALPNPLPGTVASDEATRESPKE